jgi:Domain of unknown function (DUF4340)
MGRGTRFLILVVLALGLGGYAYFVESKKDLSAPTAKKDKLFTVDAGKIDEIEVKSESGDVTTVKRNGADWQIASPAGLEPDASEITGLASTLETLEAQKTVDENPKSVKDFGLEPPRFTVAFKVAGDPAQHRINVGNKTATGGDVYARVEGQTKLILISAYLEQSLNKSTFDLRDKTVLKFTRDGVDSLKLEPAGAPAMTFSHKGDTWRLTTPIDAKADFGTIDGIVGQLSQVRMKSLVSSTAPTPAELKTYGLDKPQVIATVGSGATKASLALGGKKDDQSIYARDLSKPNVVFTLENAMLDGLKKKPEDVRSKDVFDFRTFTALGAEISYNGQSRSFEKTKGAPAAGQDASTAPDVWKQVKPDAKDVDQGKVTDLLTTLSNLHADKFADKAVTTGDELVVTARFGETASAKTEKVTFRKSGTSVHAIRAGEPGAMIVPTADFDRAVATFKEIAGIK